MQKTTATRVVDGNEAAASVAYRCNEVIAIYPITPASPMGELADEWATHRKPNLWGGVPQVTEMQSEGGAAGAVHGALQAGAMATTFTASQGLLLMLPNLYKIAGELTPFCIHVAARSVATHALSIFGDHSDVMACRQTGLAMLASASVQEAHDMACIAQAATLKSRVPFLHFFDGFRTSHEINTLNELSDEDLRFMLDEEAIQSHRARALTPDHPVIRGTAQNPDVFFQAREACNPFYENCADIVQTEMKRFSDRTGRVYKPFDYIGADNAEAVIVMMGSGVETAEQTVLWLNAQGAKLGLVKVRLYRPFSLNAFASILPDTVKQVAVLDRTKEPGSLGEPLYLDVISALHEASATGAIRSMPRVIGGRYGLSSKEFSPAMVKAVFDELQQKEPKNHFTVGIQDDLTHRSLTVDPDFNIEAEEVVRAVFYGLGSDGTVGANKNSIRIIGQETENFAQGYFVYDSKKSGATTISHLRFGPSPVHAPYLIREASFVACHQFHLLERMDVLSTAGQGACFLLNAPFTAETLWENLPPKLKDTIQDKQIRLHVIDATRVAKEAGLGRRINTVMQTCFFALSGVLPREQAIAKLKEAIEKSYGKKGASLVRKNFAAVDQTLDHLREVEVPTQRAESSTVPNKLIPNHAPDFVQRVTSVILEGHGDLLPVSAFPPDGTWPVGTASWEKRNIALDIPQWDSKICIQCNKCALVCPHAAIRAKVYPSEAVKEAPPSFLSTPYRDKAWPDSHYTIQVAPEDCTGCTLCYQVCPAKDKSNPRHRALEMVPYEDRLRQQERKNFDFFLQIPEADRSKVKRDVKGSQLLQPLFEFSGACAGCGETPYIKLLTQLFGDRLLIANATGCSSIYGGNLPTTPYTTNSDGRGPAWSNSLFEDNAEFGLGFRLALDAQRTQAESLLRTLAGKVGEKLVDEILTSPQSSETDFVAQRSRITTLRQMLTDLDSSEAKLLSNLADTLLHKSVWLVGGDGWAYDIGYGGLDHVLGQQRNVNILVLDTEVYSNTGGQASKSTPLGASAKFAAAGKDTPKKDLGMEAMSYGQAYVACVAFGAKDNQTVQAFLEADAFEGPSIIIAYSPCIAHGYDLAHGLRQQKLAVDSGYWPLYRFDPRRVQQGKAPLKLDSGPPKVALKKYTQNEARFRVAESLNPERFQRMLQAAQQQTTQRYDFYRQLAGITVQESEPPAST